MSARFVGILQEKLHFQCKICKMCQDILKTLQDLQKIFLQDLHVSCKTVFTGIYIYISETNAAEFYAYSLRMLFELKHCIPVLFFTLE